MIYLEFSLYDCVFQNIFGLISNYLSKFYLFDSSALCCILIVLSSFNKKEISI